MRKLLLFISVFIIGLFSFQSVNALELEMYNQDDNIYYFRLKATDLPSTEINSVKVALTTENAKVMGFEEYSDPSILFANKDCENGEYFSDKQVCFTLLFSEPIEEGDVLADFLVERTSKVFSMSVKIGGDSAYSNGETSYPLKKTLYEDIVLVDEKNGIIELEIGEGDLEASPVQNTDSDPTPTPGANPPVTPTTPNDNANSNSILAVGVGILLLLVVLALLYFVLKPSKTQQLPA